MNGTGLRQQKKGNSRPIFHRPKKTVSDPSMGSCFFIISSYKVASYTSVNVNSISGAHQLFL